MLAKYRFSFNGCKRGKTEGNKRRRRRGDQDDVADEKHICEFEANNVSFNNNKYC